MDVAHSHNTALFQIKSSFGSHQRNRRTACNISGLADRRFNPQLQSIRSGNFYLRSFSDRPENTNIFNSTQLQSYQRYLLVGSKLARPSDLFFLVS